MKSEKDTATKDGSGVASLTDGLDVKQLVELVRVSETAERYEDMCKFVHKLVEMKSEKGTDLDVDERNLLSVAYKNVVYKKLVEDELEVICNEVLSLLKDHLCKNVEGNGDETEVFYLKMCGDYYRYLSEFKTEPEDKAK